MQLLPVKSVLAHHFVDELLRSRIVGEISPHIHNVMLRLQQEATGSSRGLRYCGGFRFAATGSEEYAQRE
nr:Uncharacterised protein [Raoultella sp. NCTC 9187]